MIEVVLLEPAKAGSLLYCNFERGRVSAKITDDFQWEHPNAFAGEDLMGPVAFLNPLTGEVRNVKTI